MSALGVISFCADVCWMHVLLTIKNSLLFPLPSSFLPTCTYTIREYTWQLHWNPETFYSSTHLSQCILYEQNKILHHNDQGQNSDSPVIFFYFGRELLHVLKNIDSNVLRTIGITCGFLNGEVFLLFHSKYLISSEDSHLHLQKGSLRTKGQRQL